LTRLIETQAALAHACSELVEPHGRLIFATCSFLPSEGEHGVTRFLSTHPDFAEVTVRDVLGRARSEALTASDGRTLQTWRPREPLDAGDARMDGFFAAVMRRAKKAP
jgi:16S rRNA (cytosine967-C5)-methyltransferase